MLYNFIKIVEALILDENHENHILFITAVNLLINWSSHLLLL